MTRLRVEDIVRIGGNKNGRGYTITFNNGNEIWVTKRRTIPALLLLIKYGEGCEADLQRGSTRLPEIKRILDGKIPSNYIQDSYSDANKPFSELWNEEGFVWIKNEQGDRRLGSQRYALEPEDHGNFFQAVIKKAHRQSPKVEDKESIRKRQGYLCNICHSRIFPGSKIRENAFSKDRVREVFDHRVPVEKGGASGTDNFQALCFYCNKSKWQICTICKESTCDACALAFPERGTVIAPTGENIADRM